MPNTSVALDGLRSTSVFTTSRLWGGFERLPCRPSERQPQGPEGSHTHKDAQPRTAEAPEDEGGKGRSCEPDRGLARLPR